MGAAGMLAYTGSEAPARLLQVKTPATASIRIVGTGHGHLISSLCNPSRLCRCFHLQIMGAAGMLAYSGSEAPARMLQVKTPANHGRGDPARLHLLGSSCTYVAGENTCNGENLGAAGMVAYTDSEAPARMLQVKTPATASAFGGARRLLHICCRWERLQRRAGTPTTVSN